jgi:hypothetical protein
MGEVDLVIGRFFALCDFVSRQNRRENRADNEQRQIREYSSQADSIANHHFSIEQRGRDHERRERNEKKI